MKKRIELTFSIRLNSGLFLVSPVGVSRGGPPLGVRSTSPLTRLEAGSGLLCHLHGLRRRQTSWNELRLGLLLYIVARVVNPPPF